MALPTASTPGYVTYPGVVYGPDVACSCLARWLYLYQKLCVAKGYGEQVVWQLTGANENSANTHGLGGVYDFGGLNNAASMLAREAGAVDFPRDWIGNRHRHGVIDCPHNELARYQRTACIVYRRDGLGYKGLAGPDPLPAPSKWRTYEQGIDWMKSELARLNAEEDDMFTDEDRLNLNRALSAINGMRSEEAGRYSWSVGKLNDIEATVDSVRSEEANRYSWAVGKLNDILIEANLDAAEVAEIKAAVDPSAQIAALAASVQSLAATVSEIKTAVDALPKAEPAKVPATQYGVDVSGWQTVERVDTVTADPKYGFVIVKASQGMSSGNAAHDSQVAEVREAGLCVGHYHFAECDQDPIRELDNFLARAKVQKGDIVALDAEDWDQKDHPERMANTPWSQRLAFVLTWLEEAERRLGVRPLVYVNWNWIKGLRTVASQAQWDRLTRFDVWIAQWFRSGVPIKPGEYDHIDGKDGSPDGWRVVMHQWTNNDNGLDGNFMPDPALWAELAIK